MHGEKNTAILHATFIPLGFVLWNTESDERSDEPSDCAADAEACKCTHYRACSDEGTDARDRQRADAREQSECSAHCTTYADACGRAFRRLGVLFCGEIF